jgi:hypothetical protein
VSASKRTNPDVSARRETEAERKARLERAGQPQYQVVPSDDGNGAGAATGATTTIPIVALEPVKPAAITLPVQATAGKLEIGERHEAALLLRRQEIDRERTALLTTRAVQLGDLMSCRFSTEQAERAHAQAIEHQEEFIGGVPPPRRRFLRRRASRALRLVPWVLLLAETAIISRAWGIFGPVPVPFVPPSEAFTDATQVLRAGLVSFALVFGGRLAGAKVREVVDELRARHRVIGWLADTTVAGAVVAGAVLVARATAELQGALLELQAGGSNIEVPTSVLYSIAGFLVVVSFAAGYVLNEPEPEQALEHEQRVVDAKAALEAAVRLENKQRSAVRATREQLRGLDRQEQLLIAEQHAHRDEEVYEHIKANPLVFGLEMAGRTQAARDEPDV